MTILEDGRFGHEAKWEYFRSVYERYRKAEREAKQVMLNEFCLNTVTTGNMRFVF